MLRIDLEQDGFCRIVLAEDRVPDRADVGVVREVRREWRELLEAVQLAARLGEQELKSVQRRERLELDEPRLPS